MPRNREVNYKLDHRLRQVNRNDLVDQVHMYDVDLKSNHIYLFGVDRGFDTGNEDDEPGVEFVMANRFIRNLQLCMRVNPNKPILVHMKTNGGYEGEGFAIYDAIKSCPHHVIVLSYNHARSMSSIILQAADKRVLMPSSHFMFHMGTLSISDTNKNTKSYIKFSKRFDQLMLDIYAYKMQEKGEFKGKPLHGIKRWLNQQMDKHGDVYLTAEQTVKYGLADEVFDYDWQRLTSI